MPSALHQSILDAFADTQPPSRPVTGHRCDECNQVDALIGSRTWSDVAADFPEYCHDTFPLLTPEAQAYFLPAYMLRALESEGMEGISLESALEDGRLLPDRFTPAQRTAVVNWAQVYWQSVEGADPPSGIIEWWLG